MKNSVSELRDKAANFHIYSNMSNAGKRLRISLLKRTCEKAIEKLQADPVEKNNLNILDVKGLSKWNQEKLYDHVMKIQAFADSLYVELVELPSLTKQDNDDIANLMYHINHR